MLCICLKCHYCQVPDRCFHDIGGEYKNIVDVINLNFRTHISYCGHTYESVKQGFKTLFGKGANSNKYPKSVTINNIRYKLINHDKYFSEIINVTRVTNYGCFRFEMMKSSLLINEYNHKGNGVWRNCKIEKFLNNVKQDALIEIFSMEQDEKSEIISQVEKLLSSLNKGFILEQFFRKTCDNDDFYYIVSKPNYTKPALSSNI